MKYEKTKDVNFTKLRDITLKDTASVHEHNPKISRGNTVVSLYPKPK